MALPEEIRALIPADLRDIARHYWNEAQQTYYFYRLDGVKYDKTKKRGIDVRTPLGRIKNGEWAYSPSYLKLCKIDELQKQVVAGDRTRSELSKPEVKKTVKTISEQAKKTVQDPRSRMCVYPLHIVLSVMFLASLGGYTSAASVAAYWKRYRYELSIIFEGEFPETDISHDTINRLMRLIQPAQYSKFLKQFVAPVLEAANRRFIHMDGQCVRASKSADAAAGRNIFNIYESETGVLMAQKVIDTKENEIPTGTEMLKALDLRVGDVVTADAMNTQRATVEFLSSKGIDWCLALKSNHKMLHSEVMNLFNTTDESRMKINRDLDDSNGRITVRKAKVLPGRMLSKQFKELWPGIEHGSIVCSTNETQVKGGVHQGDESTEVRYFITSFSFKNSSCAEHAAHVLRRHWTIEAFHWVADVVFNQDRIQSTDTNYLLMRTASTKHAIGTLKLVQRSIRKTKEEHITINLLKDFCSTPLGALDTLAKIV